MARHKKKKNGKDGNPPKENSGAPRREDHYEKHRLHPDTKKSIWAVSFIGAAVILVLAGMGDAGPLGQSIYGVLDTLFGWGYFILPTALLFAALVLLLSE